MLSPVLVANATSLCLASLSVYYLTASVFLARSSIPELAVMPLNVSTAISAVPTGLVRKRGMLFFAEACMVLLVPTVKPGYMRSLLLGWGVRLIAGAGRALMYCNRTAAVATFSDGIHQRMSHTHIELVPTLLRHGRSTPVCDGTHGLNHLAAAPCWGITLDVLKVSGDFAFAEKVPAAHWRPEAVVSVALSLCCIAAYFHSSARSVAHQKGKLRGDEMLERTSAVSEDQQKTPRGMHIVLTLIVISRVCPLASLFRCKKLHSAYFHRQDSSAVLGRKFVVSSVLSMLGAGMLLSPELFIDSLVCTDCIKQSAYQATVTSNISPIPPATMDMFLGSQLHLSRSLTRSLGLQLVCEAANLLLLPLALEDSVLQWVLCVICALRAALATLVAALNFGLGGLLPTAHADTVMCALFALVYTAQGYLYYPAKELSNKSD